MNMGSTCSGIGCIDLGLERAGFAPAWQIEIDPQARGVLAEHWPDVRREENLQHVPDDLAPVDLVVAGTPCQDWSVAGHRQGMDGERARLFVDFIRLADRFPRAFVLWENVEPGVRTSAAGEDFAVCLEGFTGARLEVPECGWQRSGVAFGPLRWCVWRVLDLQHFGIPQRRRRLFVVAGPRDLCAPEILLEPDCLPGDLAPRREAGEVAPVFTAASARTRCREDGTGRDALIVGPRRPGVAPITSRFGSYDQVGAESQLIVDEAQITHPENRANPQPGDPAPSLAASSRPMTYWNFVGNDFAESGSVRTAQSAGAGASITVQPQGVRRLMPVEVERLFDLPDGWTAKSNGKPLADSPRYRMLGNGAGVPVVEWIGGRLMAACRAGRKQPVPYDAHQRLSEGAAA